MSSLVDLFNGMQKTASRRQPDAYDRAAAANGMTTEQYLDKVAEAHVAQEYTLVKSAQVSYDLGQYMARGYWDTLSKVANSHPVRDGVPEIYIKIAQASKFGLTENLLKVALEAAPIEAAIANLPKAKGFLERLLGGAKSTASDVGEFFGKGVTSGREAITGEGVRNISPNWYHKLVGRDPGAFNKHLSVGERGMAALDAAARLGLPAAGVGAAGTGAAYGLGAFD